MERIAIIEYENGTRHEYPVDDPEYAAYLDDRFALGLAVEMPALGLRFIGWKENTK